MIFYLLENIIIHTFDIAKYNLNRLRRNSWLTYIYILHIVYAKEKYRRRNVDAIFPMADESDCRRAEVVDCRRDDSDKTPRGTKMTYHCACSTLVDHRIPDCPHSSLCRRGPSRVPEFLSCVFTCVGVAWFTQTRLVCQYEYLLLEHECLSLIQVIRNSESLCVCCSFHQDLFSLRWVDAYVKSFFAFFREDFAYFFFFWDKRLSNLNFFFRDKPDNRISIDQKQNKN